MANTFQIYVAYPKDSLGGMENPVKYEDPQTSLHDCAILIRELVEEDAIGNIQGADIYAKSSEGKVWFFDEYESLDTVWFEYDKEI